MKLWYSPPWDSMILIKIVCYIFYNVIILLIAVWVARCTSKSFDKGGVKNAIVPEHLLEHQTSYNFTEIQEHITNTTHAYHRCRCPGFHDTYLNCFNNETHLRVGFCITYNQTTDIASVTRCPYFQPEVFTVTEHKGAHYITLPENISDINDFMCKTLNRKGRVCSECMEGYGPTVMSAGFDIQCSNCTGAWYGIPCTISVSGVFPNHTFLFHNRYIPDQHYIGFHYLLHHVQSASYYFLWSHSK